VPVLVPVLVPVVRPPVELPLELLPLVAAEVTPAVARPVEVPADDVAPVDGASMKICPETEHAAREGARKTDNRVGRIPKLMPRVVKRFHTPSRCSRERPPKRRTWMKMAKGRGRKRN
jgi:hypothetical protein